MFGFSHHHTAHWLKSSFGAKGLRCNYQGFLYYIRKWTLAQMQNTLWKMIANYLLQLNLWRSFKKFRKYCHLSLWPNTTQYYFHMIQKVPYQKCKQISHQWDPCFPRSAPNLFCVVQTVVTVSENHNKHMVVRKLNTKYHPSSICSQNIKFCTDTMLTYHFINLES
jgi:hypothetical protein